MKRKNRWILIGFVLLLLLVGCEKPTKEDSNQKAIEELVMQRQILTLKKDLEGYMKLVPSSLHSVEFKANVSNFMSFYVMDYKLTSIKIKKLEKNKAVLVVEEDSIQSAETKKIGRMDNTLFSEVNLVKEDDQWKLGTSRIVKAYVKNLDGSIKQVFQFDENMSIIQESNTQQSQIQKP